MKGIIPFILTALFLLPLSTYSQGFKDSSSWSIQLTFSPSRTFHFNAPTPLVFCIEGCEPIKQNPKFALSYHIAGSRRISNAGYITMGFGLSEIRVEDNSRDLFYGGTYQFLLASQFYDFFFGYRSRLKRVGQSTVFLEGRLHFEHLQEFTYGGLYNDVLNSVQLLFGFVYDWSDHLKLVANSYFKSAIRSYYSHHSFDLSYYPFSYGVELGFHIEF